MLRRAPHILQRVYINEIRSLNGDVDPRPINNNVGQDRLRPGSVNIDRREREVDEDHRFLLLEFMKYGNLDVMIKKLEVHRNNWNNRFTVAEWNQFLWHLFDCCKFNNQNFKASWPVEAFITTGWSYANRTVDSDKSLYCHGTASQASISECAECSRRATTGDNPSCKRHGTKEDCAF